ncbi:MAG TPA: AAA family ATPase [Pyrinomonadaceae bacterium]|nr:AAA family ATPase [Pyrinomonadaceae bacterium]
MKKYRNGLIVGKFSPLHKGHEFVINRGLAECETLYIFSYYTPEFKGCEAHKREVWLKTLFPDAKIFVINNEYVQTRFNFSLPPDDATDLEERRFVGFLWLHLVNKPLDAVFTSENYGDGYAEEMSNYFANYTDFPPVKHVLVDLDRKLIPISGTKLRSDFHNLKDYLSPQVYASFVERIVFLGGESSGKSTLTEALADEFKTKFVAEYGRTLSEEKNNELVFEDLLKIAKTHIADEESQAQKANRYLFIDTSPLTTLFYSLHLFGKADPELYWLSHRKYDRIFLCAPDFSFVQDGTREGNGLRERQHEWYLQKLSERKIFFEILTGELNERINSVKKFLAEKPESTC